MALLALGAPASYFPDQTFGNLPIPAAETSLGANTGFTFVNSPEGLVYVHSVIGASGAGNWTFLGQNGNPNKVFALANSTTHMIGPFDPSLFSNQNGLVQCNVSVTTGNSVAVYILPALHPLVTMRSLHNPFESVAGAADR